MHVACVYINVKSQKFIAEEEGVYIWMGRKWRGGGREVSIAAVPSITLNQAFLQKIVDCAFNSLEEKVALHCKVSGLLNGNRLFLTAAQAMLSFIHHRS